MYADLHIHSTASDGLLSPVEVVKKAESLGLSTISITDHDTCHGVHQALDIETNVKVVPGIEISTVYGTEEVHILGYKLDLKHPELTSKLEQIGDGRKERVFKIVKLLQKQGFDISWEDVAAVAIAAHSIGRPHVARVMIEKGYATSIAEVFQRWIGTGCPAFVDRYKLHPRQAIDLIHAAGGLAFLAHPGLLEHGLSSAAKIVQMGLDGVEAFHIHHSHQQCQQFTAFARKSQLFISGGSDCHDHNCIGEIKVQLDLVAHWLMD